MATKDKLRLQAKRHVDAGDTLSAIAVYQKHLKKKPKDITAVLELVELCKSLDDAEAAHPYLLASAPFARGNVAFCFELAQSYSRQSQVGEAERVMTELSRIVPDNAAVFRILGEFRSRLQHQVDAVEAWQRAVELEPNDARSHVQLALIMSQEYSLYDQSLVVARRAEELSQGSVQDLNDLAEFYIVNERFEDAARVYGKIFEFAADSHLTAVMYVQCLRALRELGETEALARVLGAAFDFTQKYGGRFQHRAIEYQFVSKEIAAARLEFAAGEKREVLSGLVDVYADERTKPWSYPDHTYLPNTEERVSAWRDRMNGKDAVLLLPGPSLKGLHPHAAALCDSDVHFAGMNKFDEIEATFLAPYGRHMETVVMVDRREWLRRQAALEEFVAGPGDRLLISQMTVWNYLRGASPSLSATFEAMPERFLWFSGRSLAPPSHRNPLNLQHANTLGALVPMMVLAQPRRIFIFGADGGRREGDGGNVYFHGGTAIDAEYLQHLSEQQVESEKDRYSGQLAREARHFDEAAPFVVHALAALHALPVPEIYNCCLGSGYRAFPQISIEEAMAMLADNARLKTAV